MISKVLNHHFCFGGCVLFLSFFMPLAVSAQSLFYDTDSQEDPVHSTEQNLLKN